MVDRSRGPRRSIEKDKQKVIQVANQYILTNSRKKRPYITPTLLSLRNYNRALFIVRQNRLL